MCLRSSHWAISGPHLSVWVALALLSSPALGQAAGFLGIRASKGETLDRCALIGQLAPGGPAELAGLAQGDVILAIDGIPVDCAEIQKGTPMVPALKAGDRIVFSLERAGKLLEIPVVAGGYPLEVAREMEDQARREAGFRVFQKLVRTGEVFTVTLLDAGGFEIQGGKLSPEELADLRYHFETGPEKRMFPQEMKTRSQDMYLHFDRAKGHVAFEFVSSSETGAPPRP